jgi:hypothetical protein
MWRGQKIIQVYNKKISKLKVIKKKIVNQYSQNCMVEGKYGEGIIEMHHVGFLLC